MHDIVEALPKIIAALGTAIAAIIAASRARREPKDSGDAVTCVGCGGIEQRSNPTISSSCSSSTRLTERNCPVTVFPARHAGCELGGIGTVCDDTGRCAFTSVG